MIGVELRKVALRPRVWLSIGLLGLLPALVAVLLSVSDLAPPPGQGGAFLSAVLDNGALYPAAALAMVLPVFLPLAVAVFAGDAVAGEAATGTLRYLLVRPVARPRRRGRPCRAPLPGRSGHPCRHRAGSARSPRGPRPAPGRPAP
ncbi:MAG: hypothetical protein ABIQ18_26825 [Umezawaea sp.]